MRRISQVGAVGAVPGENAAMAVLTEVPVAPMKPERFESVLGEEYRRMAPQIERARDRLRGKVVWHVNSTARGGGVAEMLRSHLSYARGAGVDVRWMVIGGDPSFYEVTKRIHNHLHESPGDSRTLGPEERQVYEQTLTANAAALQKLARPGDVFFLHDPQTAGLIAPMRETSGAVVWRCHVGVDRPGELARGAWAFLGDYVRAADAWVFSRREFVWGGLDESRVWIVPPTIDAFSPKNQDLDEEAVAAILDVTGLTNSGAAGIPTFNRADGTPGRVNRAARIEQDVPLSLDTPLLAQVSRWDRLKDPAGVLRCFAEHLRDDNAHLLLAGPDTEAVADDPEGAEVLAEVRTLRQGLDEAIGSRIHLASLPMDDLEENAAMVNAIQRRATVVTQKSLAEGFGLTVAEAMWKARPVVAGRVGGIQDQIVDNESGILVDDAADLASVAAGIDRLLADPELATRIGTSARERVQREFLALPRMLDYFRRLEAVLDGG
jgi:trehalose synthase